MYETSLKTLRVLKIAVIWITPLTSTIYSIWHIFSTAYYHIYAHFSFIHIYIPRYMHHFLHSGLKYILPTVIVALFVSANNNYNTYINAYLAQPTVYADSAYITQTPIFNTHEAAQAKVSPFGIIDYHLLNACIAHHTNAYRVKMKRHPLKFSKPLRNAAAFHALQMNERNFYNHMNNAVKQMKTPQLRIKYFDYPGEYVGENITKTFAIGYKEGQPYDKRENTFYYTTSKQDTVPYLSYDALAAHIVESWIKSPPHKKNMLDINYTHMGCAAIIETKSLGGRNMPNMLAVQNFGGDAPFNPLIEK